MAAIQAPGRSPLEPLSRSARMPSALALTEHSRQAGTSSAWPPGFPNRDPLTIPCTIKLPRQYPRPGFGREGVAITFTTAFCHSVKARPRPATNLPARPTATEAWPGRQRQPFGIGRLKPVSPLLPQPRAELFDHFLRAHRPRTHDRISRTRAPVRILQHRADESGPNHDGGANDAVPAGAAG